MTWLVTGGAGYIGAHVIRALAADGGDVVVLDDLSTGLAERVPAGTHLEVGSLLDAGLVDRVLGEHAVRGVVHIAAKKQVGESVAEPLHYYRENVTALTQLLEACRRRDVGQVVFSSSAAVYGLPDVDLVTEDTVPHPMSPYGETKLVGEWLLRDAARAYGIRAMILRYFNVAGAASDDLGDVGAFNLIPMVFERLERGEAPLVFGADYPTADGSCVRDFVHVADIASAHRIAAAALEGGSAGGTYNIGRGEGASVFDVIRVIAEVTGIAGTPDVVARRPGDPARVVADVRRIRDELGFTARHGLTEMVRSAWSARRARTTSR